MKIHSYHRALAAIQPMLPPDIPVYLVGGAVRDSLLQRNTHDLDFAVEGDGVQVARAVANGLKADFYVLDEERGTGRVLLPTETGHHTLVDFASLRGDSLEADLRARDFTINAIAVDAHNPANVFDPLQGAMDTRNKVIRACSPETFQNDPVRVVRAVRQAAELGFLITPETRSLLRAAVEKLSQVSPERLRDETLRVLGGPQPATALQALDLLGILPYIFPELIPLKGLQQPAPHIYDGWEHTIQVVKNLELILGLLGVLEYDPATAASLSTGFAVMRLGRYREQIHAHLQAVLVPDRDWRPLLFLAALYHDAGKAGTQELGPDGRIRFLRHEHIGMDLVRERARQMKLSTQETMRLGLIVKAHMRPHHLASSPELPSRRAVYRFFKDTRQAGVDVVLLNLADVLGTYGPELPQDTWAHYLDIHRALLEAWYENPQESVSPTPLINGTDLMEKFGLSPGPQLGQLLEAVREAQAGGEIHDRASALAYVDSRLKEL
jgi:tRNA nucleotidyltransferase/poly(A) polymerase